MRMPAAVLAIALGACAALPVAPAEARWPAPEPERAPTVVRNSILPAIASVLRRGRVTAVTIGSVIVVRPDDADSAHLMRHEQEHVDQWRRMGAGFAIAYIVAVILPGNRFEEEAAARAREESR